MRPLPRPRSSAVATEIAASVNAQVPLKPALANSSMVASRTAAVGVPQERVASGEERRVPGAFLGRDARRVRWRDDDDLEIDPRHLLEQTLDTAPRGGRARIGQVHIGTAERNVPTIRPSEALHPGTIPRRRASLRAGRRQAVVEDPERHLDLGGRRDERRDDPDDVHVGARGQDDELARERLGLDPLGQVGDRASGRRRRPA